MRIPLTLPRRGSGNPTPVAKNPADFAPPGSSRNWWPFDCRAGYRRRPALRAGLVKAAGKVGTSTSAAFQGGMVVERASAVSGFELVNCRSIAATGSLVTDSIYETATNLIGNAYVLAPNGGVRQVLNERGQADPNVCYETAQGLLSDPATVSGSVFGGPVCFSPDGQYRYVLSMFHVNTGSPAVPTQGFNIWSVTKFDRDGQPVAAFGAPDGFAGFNYWGEEPSIGGGYSGDSFPNHMKAVGEYLFIAAGKFVFVMRADTGRRVQQFELPQAQECMSIDKHTGDRIVVGFAGRMGTVDIADDDGSTDEDPNVGAGDQRRTGFYGRAGAALLSVTDGVGLSGPGTVLTLVQYGVKRTDTGGLNYENHKTFRIYEKSVRQPLRGCIVNAIAAAADGTVFIARTSHGWGMKENQPPSDNMAPVTVCKIGSGTSTAALLWEMDVGAIRAERKWGNTAYPASLTVHNDIPSANDSINTVADPHPTVDAICVDGVGDVYVAGRKAGASNPFNVWKVSGATGQVLWSKALSAATSHWVNQNCLRFNPATNRVVAGGLVQDAGTTKSHLWELSAANGEVLNTEDLGVEVTAYGLDTNADGEILVGTGRVYA